MAGRAARRVRKFSKRIVILLCMIEDGCELQLNKYWPREQVSEQVSRSAY